jgi:alcohol dehydrogenase
MSASLLAGLAFATCGTGLVHALQYPIGALTQTPHGLGNAVLMPAVMRFNRPVRERSLAHIARRLPSVDPSLSDTDAASAAPAAVAALARSVGVPGGLASLGVQRSDITGLAADALTVTRLIQLNPRPVDAAALEAILHDAYDADN